MPRFGSATANCEATSPGNESYVAVRSVSSRTLGFDRFLSPTPIWSPQKRLPSLPGSFSSPSPSLSPPPPVWRKGNGDNDGGISDVDDGDREDSGAVVTYASRRSSGKPSALPTVASRRRANLATSGNMRMWACKFLYIRGRRSRSHHAAGVAHSD
jgi:hypothetical protein